MESACRGGCAFLFMKMSNILDIRREKYYSITYEQLLMLQDPNIVRRGRGFKYSYFTLLLYMTLYALLTLSEVALPVDNYMIMVIGLVLSVTVQVIYCTWNEAYISLNENPKKLMAAFMALGLFNLAIGVLNLLQGNLIENGILTFHAANLVVGIMCFLLCLIVVLKRKLANGAEEEE